MIVQASRSQDQHGHHANIKTFRNLLLHSKLTDGLETWCVVPSTTKNVKMMTLNWTGLIYGKVKLFFLVGEIRKCPQFMTIEEDFGAQHLFIQSTK